MSDKVLARLTCPKCKTFWATANVTFEAPLQKKDVIVNSEWRYKVKTEASELQCPKCNHVLDRQELFTCIANSLTEIEKAVSGFKIRGKQ